MDMDAMRLPRRRPIVTGLVSLEPHRFSHRDRTTNTREQRHEGSVPVPGHPGATERRGIERGKAKGSGERREDREASRRICCEAISTVVLVTSGFHRTGNIRFFSGTTRNRRELSAMILPLALPAPARSVPLFRSSRSPSPPPLGPGSTRAVFRPDEHIHLRHLPLDTSSETIEQLSQSSHSALLTSSRDITILAEVFPTCCDSTTIDTVRTIDSMATYDDSRYRPLVLFETYWHVRECGTMRAVLHDVPWRSPATVLLLLFRLPDNFPGSTWGDTTSPLRRPFGPKRAGIPGTARCSATERHQEVESRRRNVSVGGKATGSRAADRSVVSRYSGSVAGGYESCRNMLRQQGCR